jgi:hypothetical protein
MQTVGSNEKIDLRSKVLREMIAKPSAAMQVEGTPEAFQRV